MEDDINTLKTQVELLKATDANIVAGLNDIKSLLKDMHNDNKKFQEKTHDRITRLEYDNTGVQKKIEDVQAEVTLTSNEVNAISTTITKFKAWSIGVGAGAGAGGGGALYVIGKVLGLIH